MSTSTDPPSAERKSADHCRRVIGYCRALVNRGTLLNAFRILVLVTRIVELLRRLLGDF